MFKVVKGRITMKKKLFSLFMAVAMVATLAIPAFAAGDPGGAVDKSLDYASTTKIPHVTVAMPASPKIILNPYGMVVNTSVISGDSVVSGDRTDQIISPVLHIKNQTESAMKVGLKATATPSGDAQLSTKPCTGKETTKSAFVMVELAETVSTTEPSWIAKMDDSTTINEKCYPQIIPTAEGKTSAAILSVSQPTTIASGDTLASNHIAIKLMGNLAGTPTGGWKETDTVGLKLEFTFTPGVANAVTCANTVTTITPSLSAAVIGAAVRLESSDGKTPTVQDAAGTNVTVTKVTDKLYYFVMPATAATITAVT